MYALLFGTHPGMELLGHRVSKLSDLVGSTKFSKAVVQIYIPTNSQKISKIWLTKNSYVPSGNKYILKKTLLYQVSMAWKLKYETFFFFAVLEQKYKWAILFLKGRRLERSMFW